MLALLQGMTSQAPGWLTNTWVVFGILQSAFIIGGIVAALYRFRKEKPHEDRVQPRTAGEAWVRDRTIYIRAVVAVENKGGVPFDIDHELSALEVYARIEDSETWEYEDIFDLGVRRHFRCLWKKGARSARRRNGRPGMDRDTLRGSACRKTRFLSLQRRRIYVAREGDRELVARGR